MSNFSRILFICLAFMFLFSFIVFQIGRNKEKKYQFEIEKIKQENTTLKLAISSPAINVEPSIKYTTIKEIVYVSSFSEVTILPPKPLANNLIPLKKTNTQIIEISGKRISVPYLPETANYDDKQWTISTQYFTDTDLIFSGAKRLFRRPDISIGLSGGYNLDKKNGKLGAIGLIRY